MARLILATGKLLLTASTTLQDWQAPTFLNHRQRGGGGIHAVSLSWGLFPVLSSIPLARKISSAIDAMMVAKHTSYYTVESLNKQSSYCNSKSLSIQGAAKLVLFW